MNVKERSWQSEVDRYEGEIQFDIEKKVIETNWQRATDRNWCDRNKLERSEQKQMWEKQVDMERLIEINVIEDFEKDKLKERS